MPFTAAFLVGAISPILLQHIYTKYPGRYWFTVIEIKIFHHHKIKLK